MEAFDSFKSTRRSIFSPDATLVKGDRRLEEEAFSTVLANATCEGVKDVLGPDVLQVLVSRGLLDNVGNPSEFERQLAVLFGNGTKVLERLIIKELYRELGIPYDSTSSFDYREKIEIAKEFCLTNAKAK